MAEKDHCPRATVANLLTGLTADASGQWTAMNRTLTLGFFFSCTFKDPESINWRSDRLSTRMKSSLPSSLGERGADHYVRRRELVGHHMSSCIGTHIPQ